MSVLFNLKKKKCLDLVKNDSRPAVCSCSLAFDGVTRHTYLIFIIIIIIIILFFKAPLVSWSVMMVSKELGSK